MQRTRTWLIYVAILSLIPSVAFVATAQATVQDPKISFEIKNFSFKPAKKNKPGVLKLTKGTVVTAFYEDGTSTSTNTAFETIIGARVKIPRLIQVGDSLTFLNSQVTIRKGKDVFIDGMLINITFDPGADMTDGIVTLNFGFQLDNLIFDLLNTSANSRFIDEYATFSSTFAGALALTLTSSPKKAPIDLFNSKTKGTASGEFQIPEPGTLVLLAGGIMGLVTTRRRR